MKVKLTTLALLLLVVAHIECAHGRATGAFGNRYLNDRRNLVCLELQRLGLSGPGCNSAVVGVATATPPKALRILTQQQLHQVCPVLCQNQLGSELCACEFLPAAENQLWDVDQVCTGFCDAAVNLASCGCRDRLAKIPFTGESVETTGPPDTTDNNIVDITTTTSTTRPTTTTEPDWDSLCVSLCKMGEGGALCNCDKPPFFK